MATNFEKECLYDPTKWSRRHGSEVLLPQLFKFSEEITAKVRKDIKCELNIPYGPSERTKYDVYGVDLPKDAPILVFVHGGYWQEFTKDLAGFTVPLFVKNKIKVITVGYDLCPNVKLADIVAQIKSAIAQILKYATDSGCKYLCISGHSAGAHLAASLLHDESWMNRMRQQGHLAPLKEIVLIGGIYNIAPLVDIQIGEALKLTEKEIKTLSLSKLENVADYQVSGLKVTVVVGEYDSPLFVNESREYAQKIISMVDNVEYLLLRDIDHFNIVGNLMDPNYYLAKMIIHSLRSDASIR